MKRIALTFILLTLATYCENKERTEFKSIELKVIIEK